MSLHAPAAWRYGSRPVVAGNETISQPRKESISETVTCEVCGTRDNVEDGDKCSLEPWKQTISEPRKESISETVTCDVCGTRDNVGEGNKCSMQCSLCGYILYHCAVETHPIFSSLESMENLIASPSICSSDLLDSHSTTRWLIGQKPVWPEWPLSHVEWENSNDALGRERIANEQHERDLLFLSASSQALSFADASPIPSRARLSKDEDAAEARVVCHTTNSTRLVMQQTQAQNLGIQQTQARHTSCHTTNTGTKFTSSMPESFDFDQQQHFADWQKLDNFLQAVRQMRDKAEELNQFADGNKEAKNKALTAALAAPRAGAADRTEISRGRGWQDGTEFCKGLEYTISDNQLQCPNCQEKFVDWTSCRSHIGVFVCVCVCR